MAAALLVVACPAAQAVTIGGGGSEFARGFTGRPQEVAVDARGDAWLTVAPTAGDLAGAWWLARVTPGGALRELKGSAIKGQIQGIATDETHGLVWFVAAAPTPLIGRIDENENIKLFPAPAGIDPYDIAVADDGTIWFTNATPGASGIVKVTYDAAADSVSFAARTLFSEGISARRITIGPNGELWFTVAGSAQIYRYDPVSVRAYAYSPGNLAGEVANDIAYPGGDSVWAVTRGASATSGGGGRVLRIAAQGTGTGTITQITSNINPDDRLSHIAPARDGALLVSGQPRTGPRSYIYRIDSTTNNVEHTTWTGSGPPVGLAMFGDSTTGSVWVTEPTAAAVAKLPYSALIPGPPRPAPAPPYNPAGKCADGYTNRTLFVGKGSGTMRVAGCMAAAGTRYGRSLVARLPLSLNGLVIASGRANAPADMQAFSNCNTQAACDGLNALLRKANQDTSASGGALVVNASANVIRLQTTRPVKLRLRFGLRHAALAPVSPEIPRIDLPIGIGNVQLVDFDSADVLPGALGGLLLRGHLKVSIGDRQVSVDGHIGLPGTYSATEENPTGESETGAIKLTVDPTTGDLALHDLEARIGVYELPLPYGQKIVEEILHFSDLLLSYHEETDTWKVAASVGVPFGTKLTPELKGGFEIEHGEFKSVDAGVKALHLAIDPFHQVFFETLSAHIERNPAKIAGHVEFSMIEGKTVLSRYPLLMSGDYELVPPHRLDGGVVSQTRMNLTVTTDVLGFRMREVSGTAYLGNRPYFILHGKINTGPSYEQNGFTYFDLTLADATLKVLAPASGSDVPLVALDASGGLTVLNQELAGARAVATNNGIAACGHMDIPEQTISIPAVTVPAVRIPAVKIAGVTITKAITITPAFTIPGSSFTIPGYRQAASWSSNWNAIFDDPQSVPDVRIQGDCGALDDYADVVSEQELKAAGIETELRATQGQGPPPAKHIPFQLTAAKNQKLQLSGSTAPPAVILTSPSGAQIEVGAATAKFEKVGEVLVQRDTVNKTTSIVIPSPEAGTWQLQPEPGSSGIVRFLGAAPLPTPTITSRFSRRGSSRRIAYKLRNLAGGSLQLIETDGSAQRLIASTSRAAGTVKFRPATELSARRRVVAEVRSRAGFVVLDKTIARYGARPALFEPSAPTHLRLRRAGASVTATWKQPGRRPAGWDVYVLHSSGRTRLVHTDRARLRLRVPRSESLTLRVRALVKPSIHSRPAFARLRAGSRTAGR